MLYFSVISTDGKTLLDDAHSCHAGMPVFAPAAGCELKKALSDRGLAEEDVKELKRPLAWPVNLWK